MALVQMIPLWTHYFQQVSGFVYVVDTKDRERMEETKSFLHMVMDEVTNHVSFKHLASCV